MGGVFEPVSGHGGNVFEASSTSALTQPQRAAAETVHARCPHCCDMVEAVVVERFPTWVRCRCTCGAYFTDQSSFGKALGYGGTAVQIFSVAMGVLKLLNGDLSGLGHLLNKDDT